MIDISGHLRNIRRDTGFANEEAELEVNCCGFQLFNDIDFMRNRPYGREDFQIIYLHAGEADFCIEGKIRRLGSGTVVLYRPEEVQQYTYFAHSKAQAYWIHFTGYSTEKLLEQAGLPGRVFYTGEHQHFTEIFREIMTELQLKHDGFYDLTVLLLKTLILKIGRYSKMHLNHGSRASKLDELILTLNDSYAKQWKTEEMASFCRLSTSRFLHVFRIHHQISPIQYLNRLRINKAKELLSHSSLSIKDTAALTGFSDPMYFSRVFRKLEGKSPREFIKENVGHHD